MNEMFQRLQLLLLEAGAAIADPDDGIQDERKAAKLTIRLLEAAKELSKLAEDKP
jgi:predicted DNA-binding protein (UPF0278 family)